MARTRKTHRSGSLIRTTLIHYDGGAYSQNTAGRLAAITYQPVSNGNVEPTFQEWYSYGVTGKQLKASQQNAPGPPYGPFTAQLLLNSTYTYHIEGKMTSVTYPSVSNFSATYTTAYDTMARPSTMSEGPGTFMISNVSCGRRTSC